MAEADSNPASTGNGPSNSAPDATPGEQSTADIRSFPGGRDERIAAAGSHPGPNATGNRINDHRFIKYLDRLKELRSFLIQEAVAVSSSDAAALEFGCLNRLIYRSFGGREPTEEEWLQLEWHTRALIGLLTPALRRRFLLGAVPGMLAWLPMILAPVALAALILAVLATQIDLFKVHSLSANVLPFYLFWLMSLGAIGAVAFIGMNALSIQEDITFELANRRLVILRIALGALFGLVLTLPFGFDAFKEFCETIAAGKKLGGDATGGINTGLTTHATMLVLPFILGFSTSLVILILNRFVDAVQGFFGRRDTTDDARGTAQPGTASASPHL